MIASSNGMPPLGDASSRARELLGSLKEHREFFEAKIQERKTMKRPLRQIERQHDEQERQPEETCGDSSNVVLKTTSDLTEQMRISIDEKKSRLSRMLSPPPSRACSQALRSSTDVEKCPQDPAKSPCLSVGTNSTGEMTPTSAGTTRVRENQPPRTDTLDELQDSYVTIQTGGGSELSSHSASSSVTHSIDSLHDSLSKLGEFCVVQEEVACHKPLNADLLGKQVGDSAPKSDAVPEAGSGQNTAETLSEQELSVSKMPSDVKKDEQEKSFGSSRLQPVHVRWQLSEVTNSSQAAKKFNVKGDYETSSRRSWAGGGKEVREPVTAKRKSCDAPIDQSRPSPPASESPCALPVVNVSPTTSFDASEPTSVIAISQPEIPRQLSAISRSSGLLIIDTTNTSRSITPLGTRENRAAYIGKLYRQPVVHQAQPPTTSWKANNKAATREDLEVGKLTVVAEAEDSESDDEMKGHVAGIHYIQSRVYSRESTLGSSGRLSMARTESFMSDDSSSDFTTDSNTSGWISSSDDPGSVIDDDLHADIDIYVARHAPRQKQSPVPPIPKFREMVTKKQTQIKQQQHQQHQQQPVVPKPPPPPPPSPAPLPLPTSSRKPLPAVPPKPPRPPRRKQSKALPILPPRRRRGKKRRLSSSPLIVRRKEIQIHNNVIEQPPFISPGDRSAQQENTAILPPLEPVQPEVDEFEDLSVLFGDCRGGLYQWALQTGMKEKPPPSPVSVQSCTTTQQKGRLSLSTDFRCGAKGSLYDVAVKSGCDVHKPLPLKPVETKKTTTKTKKSRKSSFVMPANGGLYYLALRSGLDKATFGSKSGFTVVCSSSTVKRPLMIPERISDMRCGAKGTSLHIALKTGRMFTPSSSLVRLTERTGFRWQ